MKRNPIYSNLICVIASFLFLNLLTSCGEVTPGGDGGDKCSLAGLEEGPKNVVASILSSNCFATSKSWTVSDVSQPDGSRNDEIKENWAGFKVNVKAEDIDGTSVIYYEATLPTGIDTPDDPDIDKVWPSKGYIELGDIDVENTSISITRLKEDKTPDATFSAASITISEDKTGIVIGFTIDASAGRRLGVASDPWRFTMSL